MRFFLAFFLAVVSLGLFFSTTPAHADRYSCAKMVYKDGWLKTYEYKGNTWGANTKKHGVSSSTVGSSTESTTGSVDPGVTTGGYISTSQYSSSWGECSMLEYYITRQHRQEYIEQNMSEIKKQIALGEGHHVDSLAFLSGCSNISQDNWIGSLKSNMPTLYDAKSGESFSESLNAIIEKNSELKANCQFPALS